jgi:hypothetical protein
MMPGIFIYLWFKIYLNIDKVNNKKYKIRDDMLGCLISRGYLIHNCKCR